VFIKLCHKHIYLRNLIYNPRFRPNFGNVSLVIELTSKLYKTMDFELWREIIVLDDVIKGTNPLPLVTTCHHWVDPPTPP